jgi:hypothetical protein
MIALADPFYITKQVHCVYNIVSMKTLHIGLACQTFPIKSSDGSDGKLQLNLQGWVYMGSAPYRVAFFQGAVIFRPFPNGPSSRGILGECQDAPEPFQFK